MELTRTHRAQIAIRACLLILMTQFAWILAASNELYPFFRGNSNPLPFTILVFGILLALIHFVVMLVVVAKGYVPWRTTSNWALPNNR